jgi:hypothetical protein
MDLPPSLPELGCCASGEVNFKERLPVMPWHALRVRRKIGEGGFGTVELVMWRGKMFAAKRNGVHSFDVRAIENEAALYGRLHPHPHPNVLQVHGLCIDAPDGMVRLMMSFCEKGSLSGELLRMGSKVCTYLKRVNRRVWHFLRVITGYVQCVAGWSLPRVRVCNRMPSY